MISLNINTCSFELNSVWVSTCPSSCQFIFLIFKILFWTSSLRQFFLRLWQTRDRALLFRNCNSPFISLPCVFMCEFQKLKLPKDCLSKALEQFFFFYAKDILSGCELNAFSLFQMHLAYVDSEYKNESLQDNLGIYVFQMIAFFSKTTLVATVHISRCSALHKLVEISKIILFLYSPWCNLSKFPFSSRDWVGKCIILSGLEIFQWDTSQEYPVSKHNGCPKSDNCSSKDRKYIGCIISRTF